MPLGVELMFGLTEWITFSCDILVTIVYYHNCFHFWAVWTIALWGSKMGVWSFVAVAGSWSLEPCIPALNQACLSVYSSVIFCLPSSYIVGILTFVVSDSKSVVLPEVEKKSWADEAQEKVVSCLQHMLRNICASCRWTIITRCSLQNFIY